MITISYVTLALIILGTAWIAGPVGFFIAAILRSGASEVEQ